MYLTSSPWLLRLTHPGRIWDLPTKEKILYLTFDDGPHAIATPFVLQQLKDYNAFGTFFCIGKNVVEEPALYQEILASGHTIGNHTYNHLNGWKTADNVYIKDIYDAKKVIDSVLFRPPYGRIKKFQIQLMKEANLQMKIIMWSVLSGDFDLNLSGEQCYKNVTDHAGKGSIVVFHDSSKAFTRLEYALPRVLEYFSKKGFTFKSIPSTL